MRLVIQYFWEINNLFDSVGYRIAINEIWKIHCAKDFPAGSIVISKNQDGPKSTAIGFRFISRALIWIDTQHWPGVLDQEMITRITNQLFEYHDLDLRLDLNLDFNCIRFNPP